ncbi:MAG: RNB domain-containing ribonuclease, partial [Alphaproteobacteria bacterium]|nr:RNB domain-containing ribonuclease [Alphaproteobacteria bacterium]
QLIEDFMLAANRAVADYALEHNVPCLYRVHDEPAADALAEFAEFVNTLGLPLRPPYDRNKLQKVLDRAASGPLAAAVTYALLRSLKQACYRPVCTDHFALAFARYCHFTSPIRRYADLLVHRALIGALGLGQGALATDHGAGTPWEEIGVHISDTERRAQRAERASMDRYLALYLEERIGARFQGRITGVTRFGLFVRLPEFGADGLVPARHLGDERWHHDAHRHSLEGMASGTVYVLGDEVEVELLEANPVTGGLILGLTAHRPVARRNPMKSKRRAGPGSRRGSAQKRGRKR